MRGIEGSWNMWTSSSLQQMHLKALESRDLMATSEPTKEHKIPDPREEITKIGQGAWRSLGGFRTFILRGNVVDLAIGIIIGAAFTTVVQALVKDILTPLIPVPSGNLSKATWHIWGGIVLDYGDFLNSLISFLIVAAVLYFFVVQPVNSLMNLYKPQETKAEPTRDCPYCMQPVNIKATRCPFCTSNLREEKE
jgi:large conductance mechanosensitive channel